MRNHRSLSIVIALTMVVTLFAGGARASSHVDKGLTGTVTIGQITSLTGAFSVYGVMEDAGFRIGLLYATNGTLKVDKAKIVVKKYNDAGASGIPDVSVATKAATTAIENDHAQILQCCASSATALAVAGVAAKYKKILMVAPAADNALSGVNRYTFRTSRENAQDAIAGAPYAYRKYGKTYMGIYQDYAFGHDQAAAWEGKLNRLGAKNLGTLYFPLTATDFTPYIQQILAKKPKFLVTECAGLQCLGLIKQFDQQGLLDQVHLMTALANIASFPSWGSAAPKIGFVGIYYYKFSHTKANTYLIKEMQKLYHRPPDIFDQDAFAAAQQIVAALKKTHSTDSKKLIKALEGQSVKGPKGDYIIRKQDHVALQPMYIARLTSSFQPVLVSTMSAKKVAPPVQTMH